MQKDSFSNKAEAFEAFDDTPLSPESDNTIGAVIARRYSRRDMLKGSLGVTAATALFGTAALTSAAGPAKAASAAFAFRELQAGVDETHHVAEGYDADILHSLGRPPGRRSRRLRPAEPDRRRPGQALRLQQRLHRVLPARSERHARPAVREPRIRQPRSHVSGSERSPRPERFRPDDASQHRRRNGGARRDRGRDRVDGRQMAPAHRQPAQSPHHGLDRNVDRRTGRRTRPAEDRRRSDGAARAGHASTTAPAARPPGAPI